jgi:predicted TIM-barrel fold metal-dependent hydrolase
MTQPPKSAHYELPAAIAAFAGEINDGDSHECTPIGAWIEEFGSEIKPLRDASLEIAAIQAGRVSDGTVPAVPPDDKPIDAHNVWNMKMENAPGAYDMGRRLQVLDFTGVKRQILFPGAAPIFAHALINKADDPNVFRSITGDRKRYGERMVDLYNDWCARQARAQDRVRPTAILIGDTPDEVYARLKRLIDAGVRAFMISPDVPLGGVSPASPLVDPIWDLASSAGCPILAHIAISENFLKTLIWREAPAFKGFMLGGEFSLDPWTLSNIHLAVQNYIVTMVLGGVFARHPKLRFGSAEFTGHWVGPLAQNMDRWYKNAPFQGDKGDRPLKMSPSDYLRRNVRVTPFEFEPVGQYIDNFGLEEVYCYASDFPHHEGGKDPMHKFVSSLEGKSAGTLKRFFVDNAKDLLPN